MVDTARYRRVVTEMKAIPDEIRAIASKKVITAEDEARLETLRGQFDKLDAESKVLVRDALLARVSPLTGEPAVSERGHTPARELDDDPFGEPASAAAPRYDNPWGIFDDEFSRRSASPAEWRSRAYAAVERANGADDATKEAMTSVIDSFDDRDARLSKIALLTSDPAYLRFWGEMLRTGGLNPLHGPAEIAAAQRVDAAARAMALTNTSGGYLIPFQLDPSVIITDDGSFNPIRRVARRVVATGNAWHGVSADASDWSWDAEAEQVSDDSSTFGQPTINIHAARGFVPISMEAFEDETNVTQEIRRLLAFGRDSLEATALITGSGNGEPVGIITALVASSPSVVVSSTTNNQYGSVDVYKVDEALPARFRQGPKAAWFANRTIWNKTDLFETSNGSKLFPGVVGNPGTLLGSPAYEAEAMDGVLATGDDYCLVYGDFDNFVIADRSSSVEFIPHLFGTSDNRPTGERGIFATFRMGSDSVLDGAFRLLKV